jgi:hypothetical protein
LDRFSAWNFGGRACPACGFSGALLYTETCDVCGLSLLQCPRCQHIECSGSKPSGLRGEIQPRELATKLLVVTKTERKRLHRYFRDEDAQNKKEIERTRVSPAQLPA